MLDRGPLERLREKLSERKTWIALAVGAVSICAGPLLLLLAAFEQADRRGPSYIEGRRRPP